MPTVEDFDREMAKCIAFRKTARFSKQPPPCEVVVTKKLGVKRSQLVSQEKANKEAAKKTNDSKVAPLPPSPPPRPSGTGEVAIAATAPAEENGGGKEEISGGQKIILWIGVAAMVYIGYRLITKKG